MSKAVEQKLIDNISIILKKSLVADATLADLRQNNKASFKAIFTKDAAFTANADTFQPYVEEIANELLAWQESQEQVVLIQLVKKIEQLFTVLNNLENNY